MRRFKHMTYIDPQPSYKEACKLVKQLRNSKTCCYIKAGYRSKSKEEYIELRKEWLARGHFAFNPNDRPWIVAWSYCTIN